VTAAKRPAAAISTERNPGAGKPGHAKAGRPKAAHPKAGHAKAGPPKAAHPKAGHPEGPAASRGTKSAAAKSKSAKPTAAKATAAKSTAAKSTAAKPTAAKAKAQAPELPPSPPGHPGARQEQEVRRAEQVAPAAGAPPRTTDSLNGHGLTAAERARRAVRKGSFVMHEAPHPQLRSSPDLNDWLIALRDALHAARRGDFSVRLPEGESSVHVAEIALAFNALMQRHEDVTLEILRVSSEVSERGLIDSRVARLPATGGWSITLESVNEILDALSFPLNEATRTLELLAAGDLSGSMPTHAGVRPFKGDVLRLSNALNATVSRLGQASSSMLWVLRELGSEGKLGIQASHENLSGTWRDLVVEVNLLSSTLTDQLRSFSRVSTAVSRGDLSQRVTVDTRGELLDLKNAINATVDQLRVFSAEVIRVAREVGTEGKLGGQADVRGLSGVWQELTDSVNGLASNLTGQVRNIAQIASAIAAGDLSQTITVDAKGEILELKNTMNATVNQLRSFASEVTRVAREVGAEGRLGAQADVGNTSGTWRDLTDSVNMLAGNLTNQVRNVALVATAIANGDLSQTITVDAKGEILELKNTMNAMVLRLQTFADEVTRVAREVGTEGKLGGQAQVPGGAGTWKALTDNVNVMASNLTSQVRGIAKVVTAVANGDLNQMLVVDSKGEIAELADTINNMTDSLRTFAEQVTTVAREVGIDGKLGGQARVPGVAGTWRDLTDNVNVLASNLTNQVRSIAQVATAIADGDLSQKITVEARGEILELKNTLNATVDRLRTFAREVTRVALEVGTEGRLGGQAHVPGVAGTWKELTESVNLMASNLTSQVRGIARVVTAVAEGQLDQRLVLEARGEIAALSDTINDMTVTLGTFADQVTTVAREVGIEGKLGGQARVPGAAGRWRELTESVNMLAGNLTSQVRNIALVTTAVANGDLSKTITVEAKGEILELKDTVNGMVERLRIFAAEVTRVAREVGTDGQLGGQALVPGVSGTWKDLTDNVNVMASNLTDQVRGISKLVTAIANGDLTRQLVLVAKGEIASLSDTINMMTETLRTFAEQVTSVAREVGIEGKLGGQAEVPGAFGTWRDLVDNVNQLAGNLTTQVRAISEVATAVTKGDLTRTIDVEALGELLALKDTINQMIANLRDTTRTNREQDWLKTNLATFTGWMQGQRSMEALAQLIISELTPSVGALLGTFYLVHRTEEEPSLTLLASYGYTARKGARHEFAFGEGLVGQAAMEKKTIHVTDIPASYAQVGSSLGSAPPRSIVVLPILFEDNARAVIELGSFHDFDPIHLSFLEQLAMSIGVVLNMIGASRRTEELLEELKRSNAELGWRSSELEEKARELEDRNRQIAETSVDLEEKAKQLELVSKYKSEFLANMSHELRTPLNSIMILANLLAENPDHNLSPQQVEYAQTVHSSGKDLLSLINQILDLSKIEAGRMEIDRRRVELEDVRTGMAQRFGPVAIEKGLEFSVTLDRDVPPALVTDPQRLNQVLLNLLSNAFKFTSAGSVHLRITYMDSTSHFESEELREAPGAVAFTIEDTGIGIPPEKQQLIFEAFQQADTSTSRAYGGTGLGLTISRELSKLLGGELLLSSTEGRGSTFVLYLPAPTRELLAFVNPLRPTPPPGTQGRPALAEGATPPPGNQPSGALPASHPGADQEARLVGRSFLLVDDDVRNLYALTSLLERLGASALPATGAEEGLALLESHPEVTAVLMDMMMPGMDGYEATRRIKRNPRFEKLPVIALTAKAMPGDREKILEAGCVEVVAKPIDRSQLVAALLQFLPDEGEVMADA